jgi:hypothetical protein
MSSTPIRAINAAEGGAPPTIHPPNRVAPPAPHHIREKLRRNLSNELYVVSLRMLTQTFTKLQKNLLVKWHASNIFCSDFCENMVHVGPSSMNE